MKKIILLLFIGLSSLSLQAQNNKVNWKDVEVRYFDHRYNDADRDSIGNSVAEWFQDGEAGSLSELSPKELKSIKKRAAKFGCDIAYVDVKKVYSPRKGDLYVLGVKRK